MYNYWLSLEPRSEWIRRNKTLIIWYLRFHLSFPRHGVCANYYLSYSSRNSELVEPSRHINESFSLGTEFKEPPSDPKKSLGSSKNSGSTAPDQGPGRDGRLPQGTWQVCDSARHSLHRPKMPQFQAFLVTVTHMLPSDYLSPSALHPPSWDHGTSDSATRGWNVVQVPGPVPILVKSKNRILQPCTFRVINRDSSSWTGKKKIDHAGKKACFWSVRLVF